MPSVSGGRAGVASASSADKTPAKPSNRGRTDLAYTQKMERVDGCKVIRFPRRIKLDEDEQPEFTARQVLMMRRLLQNNNIDLSQFPMTPAPDERQSMALAIARAYNATITDQQRKIINQYKRTPRFTFSDIGSACYPDCKLRGHVNDYNGIGLVFGCTSHDLVKYSWDEEDNYGFYKCLGQARYALNFGYKGLTPESQIQRAHWAADSVHKSMDEVFERLDGYISRDALTASELCEEKFLALDVQYKILHCLLTEDNPNKREIKAEKEHWERLEADFMKVFELFDEDDLHRLATDDDGIWCDMFDFVCDFADKEGILPKLNEARKTIAESFLSRQEDLAKWVKRLKGTS